MSDHYFTFPLAVLNGLPSHLCDSPIDPFACINLACECGMLGAGKGLKHHSGLDAFKERLEEICDEKGLTKTARPGLHTSKAEILVGSEICGVKLGGVDHQYLERAVNNVQSVVTGGPLVRMKADYFWAAFNQAKAEHFPDTPWPKRGMSWREFRVLCAILSVKVNSAGFAFIGWELIQARSCAFTTKEAFKKADSIPDHLAPPLSRKIIRPICEDLEDLGFYAKFRFSTGSRGGLTAYSVRHTREELTKAVCDSINFRDRAKIKQNRAEDAANCLQFLERAKSGPSKGQEGGQHKGQHEGQG